MKVAPNADVYAEARVGIFFPASSTPWPGTGADGDLTGQCVTQVKWFMAEMSEVPNPFSARGHARYVGQNLVAQGLADEVPANQARRGDVVCYEYGEYGHTGNLLSGGRLFQENANVAGAKKRVLSDGTVVYSSTIVPLYPSLGGVKPRFYRLKSYKEGDDMKFTTGQEQVAAIMATGYRPGDNYNYPFTVEEVTQASLDRFMQTWQGRMTTISKDAETVVAEGVTGVKGIIGKDYNSEFVGQPVVSHYPQMVQFWINYKNNMTVPPVTGKPTPLTKGLYEVK